MNRLLAELLDILMSLLTLEHGRHTFTNAAKQLTDLIRNP